MYNPVGRNKLPKKSKREQKILERLIITKAIVSKRELFIRKRNSYVKCNEGKRQKEPRTKGKSQDGLNDLVSQCAKPS